MYHWLQVKKEREKLSMDDIIRDLRAKSLEKKNTSHMDELKKLRKEKRERER